MNWKKWKIGLVIAGFTGALTAVLGFELGLTVKAALWLLAGSVAKDLLLYLKDHPYEEALDADAKAQAARVVGLLLLLAALNWGLTACSTLAPGADPIEVRAEQTIAVAGDTFDTFLKLEWENQALVRSNAPGVHAFAEWLRQPMLVYGTNLWPRDVGLVQSATIVRRAYKANRSVENKADLTAALATLEATLAEAQADIAKIKR